MEKVLRESDDGVLVYIAPTKALVTQVAAEIFARFSKNIRNGEGITFFPGSSNVLIWVRLSLGDPHSRLPHQRPTEVSDPGNCPGNVVDHDVVPAAGADLAT
jgi:hypothetical protein